MLLWIIEFLSRWQVLMGEEFRASIFNLVDLLEDNNRSSDPSQIPQYATAAQSS